MQQQRITLGILFGGKSQEHEISLISARDVIKQLDRKRYEIIPIGIDRQGHWWWQDNIDRLNQITTPQSIPLHEQSQAIALIPGSTQTFMTLNTPYEKKRLDAVFPILHGPYGEDGTVQAMLEGSNIPYVGAAVLSSAISMDKTIFKCLLRDAGLPHAAFHTLRKEAYRGNTADLEMIIAALGLPCFVKPANLGSSIATHKVYTLPQLKTAVEDAFQYADQVIFETFIQGREIECGVMGNDKPEASLPGEVHVHHDFYSYAAKYLDKNGASLTIPAELPAPIVQRIQQLALQTYQLVGCQGLARVDFFLTPKEEIIINELNTIPGLTPISLFPKMWEATGVSFPDLLDKLIDLACERAKKQSLLKIDYTPI